MDKERLAGKGRFLVELVGGSARPDFTDPEGCRYAAGGGGKNSRRSMRRA